MEQLGQSTILIVDDEPVTRGVFKAFLRGSEYRFIEAGNGRDALSIVQKEKVDLVILDILMPEMSGFEVLKKIKSISDIQNIPVIVVSSLDDPDSIEQALTIGAQDYICKVFTEKINQIQIPLKVRNLLQLKKAQDRLAQNLKQAERRSIVDDVTCLYNFRYFKERMYEEFLRSKRYHRPVSLVMIDLDHLKAVNDTFGHTLGTGVIGVIGDIIQKQCRLIDIPVRYGGDEFCIIAPDTDLGQAVIMAERLRKAIEAFGRDLDLDGIVITASMGLADQGSTDSFQSEKDLLKAADEALYRSKHSGRNRIFCYHGGNICPAAEIDNGSDATELSAG